MIQLHTDCLVFETSDGESIPCSAHDVTVELLGEAVNEIEPTLITEAAEAAIYHFKIDLGRGSITVAEFTLALERILRGFGFKVMAADENTAEGFNLSATETNPIFQRDINSTLQIIFSYILPKIC
mgnify:CR=1 FL=1